MATSDPQLDGIRRAFDNAFRRICEATTPADAEDEFSNALNHMYRLNELGKNRLGKDAFHNKLLGSDDLRAARATIWARTFDVHDVVAVAAMGDVFSDYFTAMFGVLVWKPLASLPDQTAVGPRPSPGLRQLPGEQVGARRKPPGLRRFGDPPVEAASGRRARLRQGRPRSPPRDHAQGDGQLARRPAGAAVVGGVGRHVPSGPLDRGRGQPRSWAAMARSGTVSGTSPWWSLPVPDQSMISGRRGVGRPAPAHVGHTRWSGYSYMDSRPGPAPAAARGAGVAGRSWPPTPSAGAGPDPR
jgi:hypothetical protein